MIKLIAPKARMPIAEILATVLNSTDVGFFKICQTLFDWIANDFNLSVNAITFQEKECF